ncbi:PREDICTED: piggyBac transposable element-derived protein 4-like [Dufourea novaeangliae]|uniref:piggyBac transposable element-derived protein 4-like n=1 Tax=Dufourea novaeangliae TaxID=178035 RepID=UPI000767CCA8|nr:PREDICTED: piggyBac transposable element-derived protein 4-like [Dufourea novaeangliae]
MYKKRSNTSKKASTSRGSKSRGKASNVSSCQSIDHRRITDSDENTSDSSVIVPVVNSARRLIIRDSDEEENPRPEVSLEGNWQESDNTPTIWEYSEACGVKGYVLDRLGTNDGLLDLFLIIFNENLWDIVVTETNRYAEQIMSNGRRRKQDDGWFPVTKDEILAYYALCILMAQIKKPNIQMHWSKREVIETPIFTKVMPLKRFTQISRCLHFSNNLTDCNNDRLHKIRPIINYWNDKFNNIYTPDKNISIDESLMRYKGRLMYKQFNPSKRARFGIKIYKLCKASTGFCSKFKIYTGQDKIDLIDISSEGVVTELAESVLNKGYTLYIDNWYSSPALFLKLHKQKTNVIGTVRNNRKNMPKDLSTSKLKPGEHLCRTCNGILAVRWKDKRDVYVLTKKHASVEMTEATDKRDRTKFKPNCVIDYNKGMGAIDLNDQMLACFPIMRKYIKGYKKLFFYMTDMGLYNTYVIKKQLQDPRRQSYVNYRIDIAEAILKYVQLPDYTRRGKSAEIQTTMRLQAQYWAHFPKHIDATPSKEHPTRICKEAGVNRRVCEYVEPKTADRDSQTLLCPT